MKEKDIALVLGRFQPLHIGHVHLIEEACKIGRVVVVLIGSSYAPRTIKNPFTFEERVEMIKRVTENYDTPIYFLPITDHLYSDSEWLIEINTKLQHLTQTEDVVDMNGEAVFFEDADIALVGAKKDTSSYYLNYFPNWIHLTNIEVLVNATDVREMYFKTGETPLFKVPCAVEEFLRDFKETEAYADLVAEYDYINDYKFKTRFVAANYQPVFVTVDAVTVCLGHVLMVKRKGKPGKGLWALPGGFLNNKETIADGIIRELKEETRIAIPKPELKVRLQDIAVYDAPERSLRGRTITHAGYINLSHLSSFPHIKEASDAKEVKWIPIADLKGLREQIFEDHLHIITSMINRGRV